MDNRNQLVVGRDYGAIFGLSAERGQHMIYDGGDQWTAVEGERRMSRESAATTKRALEYVNQPSVSMGSMG